MSKIFSQIQSSKPRTNTFNLSHDRKYSCQFGTITPILCLDTIPGDKINIASSQMLRFAPMIAPIMHAVNVYNHFFFVPNRIVWSNWEKFITGGEDGVQEPAFPKLSITAEKGTLADYMGCPRNNETTANAYEVSAIPFAAYAKIWNEYYRDQNLQVDTASNFPDTDLVDGLNSNDQLKVIRQRSWQHDYFTSALPWTQKGNEATIPLGSTAPIQFASLADGIADVFVDSTTGNPAASGAVTSASANLEVNLLKSNLDNSRSLRADLSSATAASINDLRRAFKLQEWLEKNARGGTRYIESIKSHFGVTSDDARLQRPEYLGGGVTPVQISEVLQTSQQTSQPSPLGTQGGHGIAVGQNAKVSYYCKEHGYIIGLQTIMPKSAYSQGLPKHFTKYDKLDFFWPSFAHLGEQPIYNREIYLGLLDGQNGDTFGYTPRYSEYKFINSSIHGEFRDTLDFWHLGRKFASRPALNSQFLELTPADTSRIFAVESSEQIYCYLHNSVKAKRLMPVFGTPTI